MPTRAYTKVHDAMPTHTHKVHGAMPTHTKVHGGQTGSGSTNHLVVTSMTRRHRTEQVVYKRQETGSKNVRGKERETIL